MSDQIDQYFMSIQIILHFNFIQKDPNLTMEQFNSTINFKANLLIHFKFNLLINLKVNLLDLLFIIN